MSEQPTRGSSARMIDAIDEHDIRQWFKTVDLAQARDTLNVCEGIYEMRREAQPKRARRKDAGLPRTVPTDKLQAHQRSLAEERGEDKPR